jgi:hypothetical protein
MVQFFKTLWDEVDLQFQGFERAEKIEIFSSILQASVSLGSTLGSTDEEREERIEELLKLAEDKNKTRD